MLGYDVSFYSANAEFSPDGSRFAHTIAASADLTTAFRPSLDVSMGETLSDEEVSKFRAVLGRHPLVEIVSLGSPAKPPVTVPQTTLSGG